ncbi:hypothetical protein JKP88DRAFT_278830 [Tribonema minus]|uniref:Uncharacterized protein n=1 Tax=Tribonema minus TaxID=303371 RepID=A0A835YVC4_9STRA|nr:hypothetical protein JKP88DRAFT_278830 [Tribonema minus]
MQIPKPEPELELKTHHHRCHSSLVSDAVGVVVGITSTVIGNTTGAVVDTAGDVIGGAGASARGLCRFVFGGSESGQEVETRACSTTRLLSHKGEGEHHCESPSD